MANAATPSSSSLKLKSKSKQKSSQPEQQAAAAEQQQVPAAQQQASSSSSSQPKYDAVLSQDDWQRLRQMLQTEPPAILERLQLASAAAALLINSALNIGNGLGSIARNCKSRT